jgi:prevent-host-death family protein
MAATLGDFMPPGIPPVVSTEELRRSLSLIVNRAAFGSNPVLITRRGSKIAAIVSIDDLIFLERMRQRRDEIRAEKVPSDPSEIGRALARSLELELLGGGTR